MTTVQSVERAFSILDVISDGATGVTDIATRAGLPKSTVARLLATLEGLGMVEQVPDGRDYRLGARLSDLSGPADSDMQLTGTLQPHLERLSMQLGEATGFGVPSRHSVRVLSQVESPNPVQVRDYTGMVFPAHVGAPGICLMAEWPAAELSRYLSRPLRAYTDRTMTDPRQIRSRLDQVCVDGYCWAHGEFAEGISSVASVVRDGNGQALGALHAHGPTYRFPAPGDGEWTADLIRGAANQVVAHSAS